MAMRFFAAKTRPAVYPWEETVNKIAVRHFALITAAACAFGCHFGSYRPRVEFSRQ